MGDIKTVKRALNINNDDLTKIFQYSSNASYRNSSAKQRFESAVVQIYERTENQTRFNTLDNVSNIISDALGYKGSLDEIDLENTPEPLKTIITKVIDLYHESE